MTEPGSLARASALIDIGRWDDALRAISDASVPPGQEARAHEMRAQCLVHLPGREREAVRAAEAAIGIDPNREFAHRLRAISYYKLGVNKEALKSVQECLRLDPQGYYPLYTMAIIQVGLTRSGGAAREYGEKLFQLYPHHSGTFEIAARVSLAEKRWTDAERFSRQGLEIDPTDTDLKRILAQALRSMDRVDEAAQTLHAAATSDPTHSTVRQELAGIGLRRAVPFAIGIFIFVRIARAISATPAMLAVVAVVVLLATGAYRTRQRILGTRSLPDHVRAGLATDQRNYFLGWVAASGGATLVVGLAVLGGEGGAQPRLAAALVGYTVLSLVLVATLWRGPFPDLFPSVRAWLRRRVGRSG